MAILFRKSKELETEIDNYLDIVDQGALIFNQGVSLYVEARSDEFETRLAELREKESRGDLLRREIEKTLYIHTLIPEARGDVLGLLESTDEVLNRMTKTLLNFSIEKPDISEDLHTYYTDLAGASGAAVENLTLAIRTYFRDFTAVRDLINKVIFYEKESDKIAEKLKRIIFKKNIELSQKAHLRIFAYHIELIADEAEDVCDRLAIAAAKRLE